MKPLKISEDIVPLGEFKAKAASIIQALRGRKNPIIVTQNGRPACVVMSPMEFDRMRAREAFFDAASEGMADIEAGRVISDEQLGQELDAEFGPLKSE